MKGTILSPNERKIVIRIFEKGCKNTEIAKIVQQSVRTVQRIVKRFEKQKARSASERLLWKTAKQNPFRVSCFWK